MKILNTAFGSFCNLLAMTSGYSLNWDHEYKEEIELNPGIKAVRREITGKHKCLTSLTRAKCGVRSTLCWKIPNISGSIELFGL